MIQYVLVGSEIQRMFKLMLSSAPKDCLCNHRAQLLNMMGPVWCRDNLKYIVAWLEEEADQRKLFEDEWLRARMTMYARRVARRKSRWFGWLADKAAKRGMSGPGMSRRMLIKRLILILIHRAEKRVKHPPLPVIEIALSDPSELEAQSMKWASDKTSDPRLQKEFARVYVDQRQRRAERDQKS